jgi:hypothetical protein
MVWCMHSCTLQGVRALHGARCRCHSAAYSARRSITAASLRHIPQSAKGKRAHPSHICTRTGLIPATPARRPGSPLPHLRRDWAHPAHICAGTGRDTYMSPPSVTAAKSEFASCSHTTPVQSRCRCGQRRAKSRRRCGRGEPSPSADVGEASPVPAPMWEGEPSYVASGRTSVTKRSTQHTPSAARTTASANGRGRPARTVASESPPGHTLAPGSFPCGGR